jgi:ABC-type Fe3+ transport system substrate-binding protein
MRALLFSIAALLATEARAQEAIAHFGAAEDRTQETLVIHGSTDIGPFSPILTSFAAQVPNLHIRYEQRSTNDIYTLAASACEAGTASADLLISSSIDQQVKLVNDGCAQPFRSKEADSIPEWANWRNEIFGLTLEPAVIVYNRELVPPDEVPQSRFDLIDLLRPPDTIYAGRIATYDIERSGLGYLFAFADSQQAATFGRLIEAFGRNNVIATCCSAEIIDGVASGKYLLAYNMLGSYALARAADDPRIGVIAPSDYTLLLSRAALIPYAARSSEHAGAFIDFALSARGRGLLADASLIVAFDERSEDDIAVIRASSSILRPIEFSPALLVGLDRHKRRLFLELWRSGIEGARAGGN